MNIPEYVQCVIDTIHRQGGKCWLVGGSVRDSFLGKEPRDYDLLTDLPLAGLKDVFGKVVVKGKQRQESAIIVSRGLPVDVASLDGRELYAELGRRDFTINSLAVDTADGSLVDYFNGREHISNKIVSCGMAPSEKMISDPIRIMRAVRFACEFGFSIADATQDAILQNTHYLQLVASERVRDEFVRMLMGSHMIASVRMMQRMGILSAVFPEIDAMCGCPQSPPHRGDVFEHTLSALEYAGDDIEVRLAVLLHDIGKPLTISVEAGAYRFYGHHQIGAKMARFLLERLRFPNVMARNVAVLIDNHMFTYHADITDAALSRLYREIGGPLAGKLVDVRICDWQSIFPDKDPSLFEEWRSRMRQIGRRFASGMMLPVIDGNDIMRLTGLPAGPEIGVIMDKVIAAIEESPGINNRNDLERYIHNIAAI